MPRKRRRFRSGTSTAGPIGSSAAYTRSTRRAGKRSSGDAPGWFQTNADFHRLVAAGAGNRRLSEMVLVLEGQMRLGLRQVSSDQNQRGRGLAEHQAILDAITGRKSDAAERLMRQHIRRTRETLALQLG